jgi:hypothetical protein
LRDIFEVE